MAAATDDEAANLGGYRAVGTTGQPDGPQRVRRRFDVAAGIVAGCVALIGTVIAGSGGYLLWAANNGVECRNPNPDDLCALGASAVGFLAILVGLAVLVPGLLVAVALLRFSSDETLPSPDVAPVDEDRVEPRCARETCERPVAARLTGLGPKGEWRLCAGHALEDLAESLRITGRPPVAVATFDGRTTNVHGPISSIELAIPEGEGGPCARCGDRRVGGYRDMWLDDGHLVCPSCVGAPGKRGRDATAEPAGGGDERLPEATARRRWRALLVWMPVLPGVTILLVGVLLNNVCAIAPHEPWDWGCVFGQIAAPYALAFGGLVTLAGLFLVVLDLRARRQR